MGRSKKPTAAELKKIRLVKIIQDVTSSGSSKDTWNPAEISEGLKNINFIRRMVDTWNPAQLNEAIKLLGFKTIDSWNPAIIDEMKTALIRMFLPKTATGNPITLNLDGELPYTIQEAKVIFTPKQSGTGDPSPTNIRPISGWDGLNLTDLPDASFEPYFDGVRRGTHKFVDLGSVDWSMSTPGGTSYNVFSHAFTDKAGNYNFVSSQYENAKTTRFFLNDGEMGVYNDTNAWTNICIRDDSYSSAADFKTAMSGVYLIYELATATTPIYTQEQYQALVTAFGGKTYTATFDSTIYGGSYDFVSGEGSETWGYIASYNGETLPGVWISDRDVYAEGTTPTTGAEVAYELSTTTPIELTGQEIEPLSGINVFSTDADTLNIKYQIDLS